MVDGWVRWWWFSVIVAACGGREVSHGRSIAPGSGGEPPTSGVAGAGGGAPAGGAGGSGFVGGEGGEGAACSQPMYSQDLPQMDGCFTGSSQGWMQVPCVCDLWLKNTTHDALAVTLTLEEQPTSTVAAADPEFAIEDADSAFYAAWSDLAAAGAPIAVEHSGDTTSLKLAGPSVVLGPVRVAACSFIIGTASVNGSDGGLDMHADFVDAVGDVVLTTDGTCFNPAPSL